VNVLKVPENINKETFEEWLQGNVCESKFQYMTDADNIMATAEE
jgi:hypothetical protein